MAQIVFVGVILLTKAGADKLMEDQAEEAKAEAAERELQMANNPTFEEGAEPGAPMHQS